MTANYRRANEPSTLMGTVCEVLSFLAGFCLLFGMGFLALAVQP